MFEPKSSAKSDAVESDSPPAPPEDISAQNILSDQQSRTWFRRGDQLFVGVMLIAVIVLMAVHWVRLSGWGLQPIEIDRLPERRFDFQLEINRATWVEWMQLEGIGETLAHRIIDDRETNGPFPSIDDIKRVKGIGPKTIAKIRPWLRVEPVAKNDPSHE